MGSMELNKTYREDCLATDRGFDKEAYCVKPISSDDCLEWVLYKHYAHRKPPIMYAFGLFERGHLVAICTFGRPCFMPLMRNAFQGEYQECFLELNRLCANEGLPRNALSFFVSRCLNMLPKPSVVVSYADSGQNHHGYIYQATNWIYTGTSVPFKDYMVKGFEGMHAFSVLDKVGRSDKHGHLDKVRLLKEQYGEENVYMVERSIKYRYFYLLGDKRERKRMRKLLIYEEKPYPKGDNVRYDASHRIREHLTLF